MAQTNGRTSSGQNTSQGSKSPTPTDGKWGRFLAPFKSLTDSAATRGSGASGQPRMRSGMGKLLTGTLVFLVAMYAFQILLFFVAGRFPGLHLELPVAASNVPLLGGIRRFDFLFIIVMAGIYFTLVRFNIIPRDPFGVKAQRQTARTDATPARTNRPLTAAERKRAARVHHTTTTSSAPSARRVAAAARTEPDELEGPNDSEYERVKAAQRQRRRRAARR